MYDVTEIGKRMKKVRGSMKQEECANKIGISRTALSNYENGSRTMDIEILYKFCDIFNVTTDYLLGRFEAPTIDENCQTAVKVTGLSQNSIERLSDWNEDNFKILDDLISNAKMNHITYLFDELQKTSRLFIGKGIPYLNDVTDMINDETAKELVSLNEKCDSITGKANKEFVKLLFIYDEREKNSSSNNIINELKLNGYIE